MPSNGLLSLSLIYCLYSWCCSSEHYLCPLLPEHSTSSCPASPSSPAEMLLSQPVNGLYCCRGSFVPTCRTQHFSFLSFRRFLLAHSSICLGLSRQQLCPRSAQSGVICKPSDHTLHPLWQGLGKDAKQVRSGQTHALIISLQAAWVSSLTT